MNESSSEEFNLDEDSDASDENVSENNVMSPTSSQKWSSIIP